ncbi:Centrosomal protein kizuna [Merluccius polli]|uniref:Centrosomal protein kizuna n=1 Tax=Merluccius polli TaxID=89951 RepID=A0AA47P491_MERPO|nr:Centrosomal protein kizuna [Merluccius polli]
MYCCRGSVRPRSTALHFSALGDQVCGLLLPLRRGLCVSGALFDFLSVTETPARSDTQSLVQRENSPLQTASCPYCRGKVIGRGLRSPALALLFIGPAGSEGLLGSGAHGNQCKHVSPPLHVATSMNMDNRTLNESRYYETIGSIQQSMHERERRRLELERKLFAHSLSDTRISQIKCAKLRSYLKEICEREKRAKMRNLELLRDVKCIEMSLKEYGPDRGTLQQQKAEHLDHISRFMAARQKKEQKLNEQKVGAAHTPAGQQDVDAWVTEDCHRIPPGTSVGRLLSSGGSGGAEAVTTSAPSHRASASSSSTSAVAAVHHSPITHAPSPQHPPSGLLSDYRVCREAATGGPANLSDDIYQVCGNSPDGCDLSVKRERTAPVSGCAITSKDVDGDDDEHSPPPPMTSVRPQQSTLLAGDLSPIWYKHSPADAVVHQSPTEEEKDVTPSVAQTFIGEESHGVPGDCEEKVSTASSSILSASSASDLSISLTESELEEDLTEDGGSLDDVAPRASRSDDQQSVKSQRSSANRSRSEADSRPTESTAERLTREGLFHLLESIEGHLQGEHTDVYSASLIDDSKLAAIISLCNREAPRVSHEDLEARSAVVLHELQRLSWSTERGCLLPWDLLQDQRSSTQPGDISASLPPGGAGLWDRWFKHALLLKERRVVSTERLLQLFTPLLLPRHATYGHQAIKRAAFNLCSAQAKVLLRTLLSRSREECAKEEEQEEERSDSSLSHGLKLGDARAARPPQYPGKRALQSGGEDSPDESPAESIPIRETKAYQLLKQSATQKWLPTSGEVEDEDEEEGEEEDDNGLTGINDAGEEDPGWEKHSSHQDPYPW